MHYWLFPIVLFPIGYSLLANFAFLTLFPRGCEEAAGHLHAAPERQGRSRGKREGLGPRSYAGRAGSCEEERPGDRGALRAVSAGRIRCRFQGVGLSCVLKTGGEK